MYEYVLNCAAYCFLIMGMYCFLVSEATSAGLGFDLLPEAGMVKSVEGR